MRFRYPIAIALLACACATACGQSSSPSSPDRPPCSFVLTPRAQTVTQSGGSFSATVTTTSSNCDWSAGADVPWIVITVGSSNATGSIIYSVPENNDAARTGSIMVRVGEASASMSVTQDAK